MKYHAKELIAHCKTRPDVWTAVAPSLRMSRDGLTAETGVSVPGLKPIKIVTVWPCWAKALRLIRRKGDRGVGDVVARWAGLTGIHWAMKRTGLDKQCGCGDRWTKLNLEYSF